MKAHSDSAREFFREFLVYMLERRDVKACLERVTDDVLWVNDKWRANDKAELAARLAEECESRKPAYAPGKIDIRACGNVFLACCDIEADSITHALTATIISSGGKPQIKTLHASQSAPRDASLARLITAADHAGVYFWEYDVRRHAMRAPYGDIRHPHMPEKLENFPESYVDSGVIAPQSREIFLSTHARLDEGQPYVQAEIKLSDERGGGWYLIKYTNTFTDSGKPAIAFATAQSMDEYKELEERFTVAAETEGFIAWRYDLKTGDYHQSKRMAGLLGGGTLLTDVPESLIREGRVHPADAETCRAAYRRLRAGEKSVTSVWRRKNIRTGAWDWYRVTYNTVFDRDGKPDHAIGSASNINAYIDAQNKYLTFQSYRDIATRDAIAIYNLNLTANSSYLPQSDNALLLKLAESGVADEFFAAAAKRLAPGDNLARAYFSRDKLIEMFEGGNHSPECECRFEFEGGAARWIRLAIRMIKNPSTQDIEAVICVFDIDYEKNMRLMVSRLVNTSYEFIGLFDAQTGKLTVLGDRPGNTPLDRDIYDSLLELRAGNLVLPDYRDECMRVMNRENVLRELREKGAFSCAFPTYSADGGEGRRLWNYLFMDDTNSTVLVTRTDISATVEAERNVKELMRAALERAEQASLAKSDFLSRMSHEIRTPMNAIIGMTALATQSVNDPEQAADCLSKIGISARFLLSLINDILDMSRIESGKVFIKREKINFEEFITNINAIAYSQANAKGVDYEAIIASFTDENYYGDIMKLQQVLLNITGNAIKFTPPGGKVQLIVNQKQRTQSEVTLSFVINDTGIGISEDFLPRLFEPFEQEHTGSTSAYGGTGLGLAICKSLIELMGGSIKVNSILGVGTEFMIEIKLEPCDDEGEAPKKSLPEGLAKLSALIVDDEILVCRQTERALEDMGVRAEWVTSGTEAARVVTEKWKNHEIYDVIFVDWKMPGMDGVETARRIRRISGDDAMIIIATAYDWAPIETEAIEAGANLLIAKPLFKSTLASALSKLFSAKAEKAKPEAEIAFDFSGRRALLVEDHILNIEVTRRLLAAKNMQVDVAENGLLAIEKFSEMPENYYDAVIMDIRMPVMDGLTAARSIRQLSKAYAKRVPIIAMSANAFDEDVEKSKAAGMNAHIAKPIEPHRLYQIINQYIERNAPQ